MRPFDDRDGLLAVEADLIALVGDGHSRTDATMVLIERIAAEAEDATTVVLVEGLSDQIAVEVLAGRQGRALRADGTFVVPAGGYTNFARLLAKFGPNGRDARLAGLYDSPVEERMRRSLDTAGIGPDASRFYRCVTDLEDEMIRALGPAKVEQIVEAEGELAAFRKLQQMPFHRRRPLDDQLHRFIGTHSGRKYRYARSLARSLDLTMLPAPLADLFGHL